MFCNKCGSIICENDRFCKNCGNKIALLCPKCSKPYLENQRFCSYCGEALKISRGEISDNFSIETVLNQYKGLAYLCIYCLSDENLIMKDKYLNKVRDKFILSFDEKMYLIIDTSIFNNAKDGIVVSNLGVSCKSGDVVRKYKWNEFKDIEIKNINSTVIIGRLPLTTSTNMAKKIIEIMNCLKNMVQ